MLLRWPGGCSSSDVLDGALAVDEFSQNWGKEELLMHLVGAGSLADRRRVREGQVQLTRKSCDGG